MHLCFKNSQGSTPQDPPPLASGAGWPHRGQLVRSQHPPTFLSWVRPSTSRSGHPRMEMTTDILTVKGNVNGRLPSNQTTYRDSNHPSCVTTFSLPGGDHGRGEHCSTCISTAASVLNQVTNYFAVFPLYTEMHQQHISLPT